MSAESFKTSRTSDFGSRERPAPSDRALSIGLQSVSGGASLHSIVFEGVSMAACTDCGRKLGLFDPGSGGLCHGCSTRLSALARMGHEEAQAYTEARAERDAAIEAIMLTTETAPNLPITKRIEIVTAECAFGMNIFKDLFAGIRDIVGGRSEAVQKTMRDARRTALYELKREAHAVGGNAVVGVDLDYVELSAAGSMVMLVASGTAVVLQESTNIDS